MRVRCKSVRHLSIYLRNWKRKVDDRRDGTVASKGRMDGRCRVEAGDAVNELEMNESVVDVRDERRRATNLGRYRVLVVPDVDGHTKLREAKEDVKQLNDESVALFD